MDLVGTIPIANLVGKPQLVVLNTNYADRKSSTLSTVTFDLDAPITAPDRTYAGIVQLQNFIYRNTFDNFTPLNNKLQVCTTYVDDINGPDYKIRDISIPTGYYDVDDIVSYLQGELAYISEVSGLSFGFGTVNGSDAVKFNEQLKRLYLTPNSVVGLGPLNNPTNPTLKITGTYLVLNDTTLPCMKHLGFLNTGMQGENLSSHRITEITNEEIYGYGYTYFMNVNNLHEISSLTPSPRTAPNIVQLSGPASLNVQIDGLYGGYSGSGLVRSNVIAMVPNEAASGIVNYYSPSNPYRSIVNNLNLNNISIRISDTATGAAVDFHGASWSMSLLIEFQEIKKSQEIAQNTRLLPMFHNTLYDHTIPDPKEGRKRSKRMF